MPLEEGDTFFFAPRPLKNLVLVDEMESLSPVLACHIADLGNELFLTKSIGRNDELRVFKSSFPDLVGSADVQRRTETCLLRLFQRVGSWVLISRLFSLANEDTPQLYALCGRGPRSTLRVLRHGLEVSEMAVSELPGNPNAVWTVKRRADGEFRLSMACVVASCI